MPDDEGRQLTPATLEVLREWMATALQQPFRLLYANHAHALCRDGAPVRHAWNAPGAYPVSRPLQDGSAAATGAFVLDEAVDGGAVLHPSAIEASTSAMEVMAVSATNAALLVRMAAQKADSGASTESVVGWLDELLIKMMKSLAQYRKGDPASVVPPPPLAQLPQLIFHLRRSGVLRVAGFSPDRTAAFRLLASSLSVFSTLVLIQPTLTGLEPGRPPAPLPLDSASIAPSRTLLLDTFQQVVLCHGAHVAAWMKEKEPKENPELQKLLDDSRERAAALAANRFPAPERIECTQYSSKARYLTQKLHADVSLLDFLRALSKTTVE